MKVILNHKDKTARLIDGRGNTRFTDYRQACDDVSLGRLKEHVEEGKK